MPQSAGLGTTTLGITPAPKRGRGYAPKVGLATTAHNPSVFRDVIPSTVTATTPTNAYVIAVGKELSALNAKGTPDAFMAPAKNRGTVFATKVGEDCSATRTSITVLTTNLARTTGRASIPDKVPILVPALQVMPDPTAKRCPRLLWAAGQAYARMEPLVWRKAKVVTSVSVLMVGKERIARKVVFLV